MLEAAVWNLEVADGRNHVPGNFCLLAVQALSGPAADVSSHVGPHHFGLNHLARPFDARVPESMEDVENLFPKCKWNIGSRRTITYVDYERPLADIHRLKVEAVSCVGAELSKLWVQRLLRGYFCPINPHVPYG